MTAETVVLYHSKGDLLSQIIEFLKFPINMVPVDAANIITTGELKGKRLDQVFPTAEPPLLDNGREFKTTNIAIIMYLLENSHSERLVEYPLGSEARFCCFDNLHRISGLNICDLEEEDLEFSEKVSMEQLVVYFLIKDMEVSYLTNLNQFKLKFEKVFCEGNGGKVEHNGETAGHDLQTLHAIYDSHVFSSGVKNDSVVDLQTKLYEDLVSHGFNARHISLNSYSVIIVDHDGEQYLLDIGFNGPLKPVPIIHESEFAAGAGRFLKMGLEGSVVSVKLWNSLKNPNNYAYQDLYRIDLEKNGGSLIERDQDIVFVKRIQNGSAFLVNKLMEGNGREKFEVKMVDYSGNCLRSKVYALSESNVEWKDFISDFEATESI